ncbi:MAG: hypothetical protein COY81_01040 [Candidatus Pacebacteria bacterium CG_4_10_14_0_8_um_filter_43_12]|nr:MAG: hypothetical protein COU66_01475 [Candidatus Pacebacteria bacterium CG10_big_fil_rev_8_21_14_0_10_44_11]PIY79732.1 MAG: hypothetical protein COY81_01040 [Candidatus Pacebacteria bacterium CG_4_10_14_0_8_um_filter_43_12]
MAILRKESGELIWLHQGIPIKGRNRLEKNSPKLQKYTGEGHSRQSTRQLQRKYRPQTAPRAAAYETFSYRHWLGLSVLQAALARGAERRFRQERQKID